MIRNYKDKKIYTHLKIAKNYFLISLVIAILTLIPDITIYFIKSDNFLFDFHANLNDYFMFIVFLILMPLGNLLYCVRSINPSKNTKETYFNNDKANILSIIISTYIEYYLLIFYIIIGILSNDYSAVIIWARACGAMLISHLFSFVGTIYLIKNYKIIKRNFDDNPPEFKLNEIKRNKELENQKKAAEDEKLYFSLIQNCGFRFFIKYFEQVKNLPLKDISIEENIDTEDIEMRVKIIKKIIDNNLVHYCCENIKREYGSYLSEEEKTLLDKMNKDNY